MIAVKKLTEFFFNMINKNRKDATKNFPKIRLLIAPLEKNDLPAQTESLKIKHPLTPTNYCILKVF